MGMAKYVWRKASLTRQEINENRQRLRLWYESNTGQLLADLEIQHLDQVLATLFGYYVVQVGCVVNRDLLKESRVKYCIVMDPDPHSVPVPQVFAYPDSLPVVADAVDVVVLPHTLEFERDPHQILREVDRVLIPEGHVIIFGFNPWSLWGVWRLLLAHRMQPPWTGRFLSTMRCQDWLALLGFDLVLERQFFFRPPLQHLGVMRRLHFMERLGQRFWRRNAGVYMLVAKKRVTTLTPIRPRWRPRRSLIGTLAGPSPRRVRCSKMG